MSNLNVNTIQNTSSVNSITIDTSGRVLYPQNPAFCARNSTNPNGDGTIRIIVFPTIDFNIGSGYNSTTGRFTAPVSGVYYLTYHLFGDGNTQRHLSALTINGSQVYEATQEYRGGTLDPGLSNLEAHTLQYMNQNDYAEVRAYVKILASNNSYSCFTGYLVGS
jgi:hypothetical protein